MILTQVFSKVLNMSMTASLVIVLVIAARFILRKSPKVFSYALWAVVLFRLLCPVSLPSPVSLLGLLDAPVTQSKGITNTVEYIPYKVVEKPVAENPALSQLLQNTTIQLPTHGQQNTIQNPTQSQQTTVPPEKKPISAAEIIAYIWISGIAVMAIVGVGSYLRFRKHLTVAMQVKDNIYLVDHIDSAFVAGLIRPKVYLPSDIPVTQMGYIIAHEQYHIRRLDHVTKHLSFAALCIHWFNPFVWVAFILSGKDLEMSCDEAVIKKLGEDIRADYSASLLSLATGRRIIAGTPLAFGEGDTKGRIKNMAKWKQPKKWVSIVSFMLCFAILTACAANPAQEVVISKNDGAFDANISETAPGPNDPTATQPINHEASFSSTDERVNFYLLIDDTVSAAHMPVIEVVPHYLSEEDAERVAYALFGNADFYEADPILAPVYSKDNIQKKLSRWSQYINKEALTELYGEYIDGTVDIVKKFIEEYTREYAQAPSEDPHMICNWKFKKIPVYYFSQAEVASMDLENENDGVQATLWLGEIPYRYNAETRNKNDFKANYINAYIDDGISPDFIDSRIFRAQLCRTDIPTGSQIASIQEKAELILANMQLGEWIVDEIYVATATYGTVVEYTVCVNAAPVLNGIPTLRQTQILNLTSDDIYASNYNMSEVNFQFSANGDLLNFVLYSPIDISKVVNSKVAVLSIGELIEIAKSHFLYSDFSQYDSSMLFDPDDKTVACDVTINRIEYGLSRIRVPNTDASYYYIPSVAFYGDIAFTNKDTGDVYHFEESKRLVMLNAVDGTIINEVNQ